MRVRMVVRGEVRVMRVGMVQVQEVLTGQRLVERRVREGREGRVEGAARVVAAVAGALLVVPAHCHTPAI